MLMIVLKKVEEGIPPPTGNPFPLFVSDRWGDPRVGIWTIDTGLELTLPGRVGEVGLEILPGFGSQILSWSLAGYRVPFGPELPKGRLVVAAIAPRFKEGEPFASACVVEMKKVGVRFVQRGPEGGRVIRGDAKIASCAEDRGSES